MQVCFFTKLREKNTPQYGIVRDQKIFRLRNVNLFENELEEHGEEISTNEVEFLPPVTPSKIVCVGRNYAEHAAELGNEIPPEPLLFLKAPSAIITNDAPIILPAQSERVEHEGEIGVVIGRTANKLTAAEDSLSYVFGYLCLNDVTARDLQRRDIQFTRAKSFDTFCPLGNIIETEFDPENIEVTVTVNGIVKQQGNSRQMVFPIAELIRYVSNQMTLFPGDIIATGTPSGVSQLQSGDVVEVNLNGALNLSNPVREQQKEKEGKL